MTCKHAEAGSLFMVTSKLGCSFCADEARGNRLADLALQAFGYSGDDPLKAIELGIVRLQADAKRFDADSAASFCGMVKLRDEAVAERDRMKAVYEAAKELYSTDCSGLPGCLVHDGEHDAECLQELNEAALWRACSADDRRAKERGQ